MEEPVRIKKSERFLNFLHRTNEYMIEEGRDPMFNRENDWIGRIQREGHEGSANKLIQKYYKEIYAYTYKRVFEKELAMDLTQEIFIRMLQSIQRYEVQRASFRTWLYQIAHHHCVDYFRSALYKMQRQTSELIDTNIESKGNLVDELVQKERIEEVYMLLNTFNAQERMIVLGKLLHDMTFSELAELLQLPLSTVKSKYYKTIRQVKYRME